MQRPVSISESPSVRAQEAEYAEKKSSCLLFWETGYERCVCWRKRLIK